MTQRRQSHVPAAGVCWMCGCTEDNACPEWVQIPRIPIFQGCSWVDSERQLCSLCASGCHVLEISNWHTLGINKLLRLHRNEKRAGSIRRRLRDDLWLMLRSQHPYLREHSPLAGPFVVWYQRRAMRRCDTDNATVKLLLDALQHAGVIPNDGPKVIVDVRTSQAHVSTPSREGFLLVLEPALEIPTKPREGINHQTEAH